MKNTCKHGVRIGIVCEWCEEERADVSSSALSAEVMILPQSAEDMLYDYEVWRTNEGVFYSISRDGQEINNYKMEVRDLGFWKGLVWVYTATVEKETEWFFKKAHEFAKRAIENLKKYEKLKMMKKELAKVNK